MILHFWINIVWKISNIFIILVIFVFSLLPTQSIPLNKDIFNYDKILHLISYSILGTSFILADWNVLKLQSYRYYGKFEVFNSKLVLIFTLCTGYGFLIEILQLLSGYRNFDIIDWLFDILGVLLSIIGLIIYNHIKKSKKLLVN
ncbi:MAG: VanZ family protein [Candidatus Thorarchaeota archaeon]